MYYEVGDTVTFTDSGTGKTITGALIIAKVDHLLDGAPGFIAAIKKQRTWGMASEISYVAPRARGR
jgi:hypothetical protein